MHKISVLFDGDVIRSRRSGKLFFETEEVKFDFISCPKTGTKVYMHEGFGRFCEYTLQRVFENGKFSCMIAKRSRAFLTAEEVRKIKE